MAAVSSLVLRQEEAGGSCRLSASWAAAYGIPNEAGAYVNVPLPVRIGAFRGNNDTHNGFMLESMIDDAAHEAGMDPLAYRRRLLAKDARSIAVLDRAAAIAGWGKVAAGPSPRRGVLAVRLLPLSARRDRGGFRDGRCPQSGAARRRLRLRPRNQPDARRASGRSGNDIRAEQRDERADHTRRAGRPSRPISIPIRFFGSTRRPTSPSRSSRLARSRAASARSERCRCVQLWATRSSPRLANEFGPRPSGPMGSRSFEGSTRQRR